MVIAFDWNLGKEYSAADLRWGVSEPTVVSLEILTVLGGVPMCFYILKQLVNDDPARHYWLVVLCTAELYGGYVINDAFPILS
jgi:Emopamil binding protein.